MIIEKYNKKKNVKYNKKYEKSRERQGEIWSEKVLDIFWPSICPFCGKVNRGGVCPLCRKAVAKEIEITVAKLNDLNMDYSEVVDFKDFRKKFYEDWW